MVEYSCAPSVLHHLPSIAEVQLNTWVAVSPDRTDEQWKQGVRFWIGRVVSIDKKDGIVHLEWLEHVSAKVFKLIEDDEDALGQVPVGAIMVAGLHMQSTYLTDDKNDHFRLLTAPELIHSAYPTPSQTDRSLRLFSQGQSQFKPAELLL
jgi:hypothetical protein